MRIPARAGTLAAWVYRPNVDRVSPAVVMAHGFGAIRELRLGAYAERFADAGFAVVVFDYRHFGASDGEPRQLLDIKRQLADWRDALGWTRAQPFVDEARVAAWGTSFSGGHVLTLAAAGEPFTAGIAQVPYVDGWAAVRTVDPLVAGRLAAAALRDWAGAAFGRPPIRVPIIGRPGELAAMTAPDALPGFLNMVSPSRKLTELELSVAARIFLHLPLYRPARMTARIRCPMLVQIARDDSVAPAGVTWRAVSQIRRVQIETYPIGHFEIYVGTWFEIAVSCQVEFLRRHLGVPDPSLP